MFTVIEKTLETRYGDMSGKIKVKNGKITEVQVTKGNRGAVIKLNLSSTTDSRDYPQKVSDTYESIYNLKCVCDELLLEIKRINSE